MLFLIANSVYVAYISSDQTDNSNLLQEKY